MPVTLRGGKPKFKGFEGLTTSDLFPPRAAKSPGAPSLPTRRVYAYRGGSVVDISKEHANEQRAPVIIPSGKQWNRR